MIKNIKFGIKISTSNFDLLSDIYTNNDIIDFFEIIISPDFNLDDLIAIKNLKMPYAIHLPNSNNNIDFGNINRNNKNLQFINKINKNTKSFKELNPICYIVHPESENLNLSIHNITKLKIKPIALENMPVKGIHGEKLLGYNPKSIKYYFEKIKNLEFCLDISHAIKAAISLKINHLIFINKFLNFKKPKIFHLSGGNLNIEIDEHLPLFKGQYNIHEIKNLLINYSAPVNLTFENYRNYGNGIEDDLNNIKYFLES